MWRFYWNQILVIDHKVEHQVQVSISFATLDGFSFPPMIMKLRYIKSKSNYLKSIPYLRLWNYHKSFKGFLIKKLFYYFFLQLIWDLRTTQIWIARKITKFLDLHILKKIEIQSKLMNIWNCHCSFLLLLN